MNRLEPRHIPGKQVGETLVTPVRNEDSQRTTGQTEDQVFR